MKRVKVSVVKIANYESGNLSRALRKSLDYLGGLENIIKPRSKVFVKINHLSPSSSPEKPIITNPLFTKEVVCLLKEFGHQIIVGDDIQSLPYDGFSISGYRKICKELGVKLVNLKETGFRAMTCKGQLLKKVFISPLPLESDYILNLPKLKTHSFTIFTGAIKNMFGLIPHGLRLQYHREFMRNEIFSQMLVDIFSCAPPHLTIMDAITAMEGEGPSAGKARNVGLILASEDAVALDAVASKIVGFNPFDIHSTQNAHERNLGVAELKNIDILGESIQDVRIRNFKHSTIAIGFLRRRIPSFLYAYLQKELVLIPEVDQKKCTKCLECVKICPVQASRKRRKSVWINKKECIHCMCCHEICRYQAIRLHRKPFGHLFRLATMLGRRLS